MSPKTGIRKCVNERSQYYMKKVRISGGIVGAIPFYCVQEDCRVYHSECEMHSWFWEEENKETKK